MNKFKFITYVLLAFFAFGVQSCGDDNGDEPTVSDIKGTWLLTHYSYKYHYFENGVWWDDTKDEVVTEFIIVGYDGSDMGKWWDHITFTHNIMDIGLLQYNLPTQPLASDYDIDTIDGQVEYNKALEEWEDALESTGMRPSFSYAGDEMDSWLCPYSLKGNKLYIGTLYNGDIEFIDSESFTLTYKDATFDREGEYKLYIYTFKHNS